MPGLTPVRNGMRRLTFPLVWRQYLLSAKWTLDARISLACDVAYDNTDVHRRRPERGAILQPELPTATAGNSFSGLTL